MGNVVPALKAQISLKAKEPCEPECPLCWNSISHYKALKQWKCGEMGNLTMWTKASLSPKSHYSHGTITQTAWRPRQQEEGACALMHAHKQRSKEGLECHPLMEISTLWQECNHLLMERNVGQLLEGILRDQGWANSLHRDHLIALPCQLDTTKHQLLRGNAFMDSFQRATQLLFYREGINQPFKTPSSS